MKKVSAAGGDGGEERFAEKLEQARGHLPPQGRGVHQCPGLDDGVVAWQLARNYRAAIRSDAGRNVKPSDFWTVALDRCNTD